MSKYAVYAFGKKVAFDEKRHQVKVDHKLIVSHAGPTSERAGKDPGEELRNRK